jgi:phospholipid-translocating ATPase
MYEGIKMEKAVLEPQDPFDTYFSYLILLSPMLPLELYGIFDFMLIMNKFTVEKACLQKEKEKKNVTEITNPDIFSNLAHIQYVFLDKTGTLTENTLTITQIFFNGKIYFFHDLDKFLMDIKLKKVETSKSHLESDK